MMTGHTYTKLRESSKEVEVQWTEVFTGHMLLRAVRHSRAACTEFKICG